jgi:hypothetical protein
MSEEQQYNREMNRRLLRALAWLARQFLADLRATLGGLR